MPNAVQRFFQKALGVEAASRAVEPAAEQRSIGVALSNTPGMMALLNLSSGNINVNDTTICGIPALSRAIDIVAGAIAKMPVTVFQRDNGTITVLEKHPAHYLCNLEPNSEQIPYTFWWSLIANAFLSGGGGAEIIRNTNGKPISLRLMRMGCTPYKLNTYDPLRYWDNETGKMYLPDDVLFIPGVFIRDGFTAKPLALAFRDTFGEPLAQQLLLNTLFKQGAFPRFIYSYQGTKSGNKGDEAVARELSQYFGGIELAGGFLPIPNIDKVIPLNPTSMVDSQMQAMRQFSIAEVSRITGVPADMLGETEKQSYSFSEQSAKSFTLFTLDPWFTKRDQELRSKLLTESEKGRINIETHVNEQMWMLPKDRMEYNWKKFQMGALNPNEIRAYDNESPIPSGDKYFVQAQLIPIDQIAEFWAAKNPNPGTQSTTQRAAEPVGTKLNGHHVEN